MTEGMEMNAQDMQVVQGQKVLRRGYTTGSTATGAAKYALLKISENLGGEPMEGRYKEITVSKKKDGKEEITRHRGEVLSIKTLSGIVADVEIKEAFSQQPLAATAIAIKDSGDDPDVTHRAEIGASLTVEDLSLDFAKTRDYLYAVDLASFAYEVVDTFQEEADYWRDLQRFLPGGAEKNTYTFFAIRGGKGVGRVTKKGLSPSLYHSAINKGPRQMLLDHLIEVLKKNANLQASLRGRVLAIEISVEEGEALAQRTFNPKLGIQGGISIIGTSGIVEPMSEKALVDTIKTELDQFAAEDKGRPLLICPGNYGQAFIEEALGIDIDKSIKVSNYIGEALDYSVYLGVREALFVGHAGKLIKLAASIMNTHSSYADGRAEIMASHASIQGASRESLEKIMAAISIDEMLETLQENGAEVFQNTMASIGAAIRRNLDHRTKNELHVAFVVFTNEYGIIIQSDRAKELAERIQEDL